MRNKIIVSLLFVGFIINAVYAMANKETLYNCYPDSNSTIAYIVPGKVWNEKDCIMYGDVLSESYKTCVSEVKDYNQKTLNLYKMGKCEKVGYRISGTSGDLKCSMDYNSKQIFGYATTGSGSNYEWCLKNLAKEIKAQYPNIKGDSKYGFAQ